MSRASLIGAAKLVGVSLIEHSRGRSVPKMVGALRLDLIHRTYGPGMHWKAKDATEMDGKIVRAVACCLGKYGYLLSLSQSALKYANDERAEYKRLTELKRRRPKDEARLLLSARQWMQIARISQDLHAVERGIDAP